HWSAVIARAIRMVIAPEPRTFPYTRREIIKTKRTINAPIVASTTFGGRSKIIATVTSRGLRQATRMDTKATRLIPHYQRECTGEARLPLQITRAHLATTTALPTPNLLRLMPTTPQLQRMVR